MRTCPRSEFNVRLTAQPKKLSRKLSCPSKLFFRRRLRDLDGIDMRRTVHIRVEPDPFVVQRDGHIRFAITAVIILLCQIDQPLAGDRAVRLRAKQFDPRSILREGNLSGIHQVFWVGNLCP